jgi:DUF883 C-terminal glycine zipper region
MSIVTDPASPELNQAKSALIQAAKEIDLLAPMRKHPFTSVGVAAGVGAVLGMNRGRLIATASLTRAISSFARLVALAVEKYLVASADHAATQMHQEPVKTPAQT